MPFQDNILASKLSIPQHPAIFVPSRLSGLLARMTRKRLAVVVAGAGHGKTALTAHGVKQTGIKTVWYSLDARDQDFSRFIRYLVAGFRPYAGNEGEPMKRLMSEAVVTSMARIRVLEAFIHFMAPSAAEKIILVLDDFHTVQASMEVQESIESLLTHLPPSCHMIILTRADPKIKTSRLRLLDQVAEIKEPDLLFTSLETRALYAQHFNLLLSAGFVAQLHQKSNGWVAVLVLFYLTLKGKSPDRMEEELGDLSGSNKLVFTYLEEKIFRSLPCETRDFMLKTALLDTLVPEFCDAYLNVNHSRTILDQLADNHLLTSKNGAGQIIPDSYTYHHLLQSFLRTKLKQAWSQETVGELYRKIARLHGANGDDILAVQAYIEGGDYPIATERLIRWETSLFQSGQVHLIRRLMDGFPKRFVRSTPQLLYINAKLDSFSGDEYSAISLFEAALKEFEKCPSEQHVLDCQVQLGLNYYYTGHIQEAENLLESCMDCKNPEKRLEIAGLLILICSILGKIDTADRYGETARKELAELPCPGRVRMETWISFTRSYRFFVSGDFKRAYAMGRQTLDRYSKMGAHIIWVRLFCNMPDNSF
ncbi:MAG: hypothetical protein JEZ12_28760 [Desulfobacterium sp.]|nr:hypothetical protein [Desulfobacterium sp.]